MTIPEAIPPPRAPPPPPRPTSAVDRFLAVGPFLFFLSALFFDLLFMHPSTDLWLGLVCGRRILETGHVPTTDPFSYTFAGQPFHDQNWLTHVIQYWLWDRIGSAAELSFFWGLNVLVFGLVLRSVRLRSGSWTAALLGTGVVTAASRGFLDMRGVTLGLTCLASLAAVLNGLSAAGRASRWRSSLWAFPILLFWGQVHGSFLLGYGLVGVFLGCWVLGRFVRLLALEVSTGSIVALAGGAVAAALATLTGPYGLGNFTHPFVVSGSETFRAIAEWHVPWELNRPDSPLVWPFWSVLAVAVVAGDLAALIGGSAGERATPAARRGRSGAVRLATLVCVVVTFRAGLVLLVHHLARGGLTAWSREARVALVAALVVVPALLLAVSFRESPRAAGDRTERFRITTFDLIVIGIGLFLALWGRRFAPFFYILATPTAVLWIIQSGRAAWNAAPLAWSRTVRTAALVPAVLLASTGGTGVRSLRAAERARPELDLLEHYVQWERFPQNVVDFLACCEESVNVLTEYALAGPLLYRLPQARVFIDGRSQQVYDERHLARYLETFDPSRCDLPAALRWFEECGTDAVLLRRREEVGHLLLALGEDPGWLLTLYTRDSALFLRPDSKALTRVIEAERADRLDWPADPDAVASRGRLWLYMSPPDPRRALGYLETSVAADPSVGVIAYPALVDCDVLLGREREGLAWFESETGRLQSDPELPDPDRAFLLRLAAQCRERLERSSERSP